MAIHCQTCGIELSTWTGKCPECGGTSQMEIRTQQDPMLGKLIAGKYKISKKLGQGGMGSVYLAENEGVGQRVAIKFLNPNFFGEATVVQRFLNEARSYAQVSHPHAVQLHDFGQDETGNLYISMEYIEGFDLKKLLEQEKRIPWRDSLDIVLQICDVLAYAHGKGIIHRDLKPENTMLVKSLRGWHAKVLDFGVARLMAEGTRVTAAGSICGTPRYMAPEQAEGGDIDHRADVYALGLVLFECLTGHHPFIAGTIAETMRRQVMEPMPHLNEVAPDLKLPDALDAAIQKATAKDREQRYGSMTEFAKALVALTPTATLDAGLLAQGVEQAHTVVRGKPVEKTSHKGSPYQRSGEGAAPSRLPLYAGLGVAVLLLGGAGIWAATRTPPTQLVLDIKPEPKPDILPNPPPPPDLKPEVKPEVKPGPPEVKPEVHAGTPAPKGVIEADPNPKNPNPHPNPNPRADGSAEVRLALETGLLRNARGDFNNGNLGQALTFLHEIPESSTIHGEAGALGAKIAEIQGLLAKGNDLKARNKCEQAMAIFNKVLELNPGVSVASQGLKDCKKATVPTVLSE